MTASFGRGRAAEPPAEHDTTKLWDEIDADRATRDEADRQARRDYDERQQAAHLDYLREQAALLREIADARSVIAAPHDPEGPTA